MVNQNSRGFAIIEIIIVVVFVALFIGVFLYSANAQPKSTGNNQRRADVNAILRSLEQYAQKNNGALPGGVTDVPKLIASTPGETAVDLCKALAPNLIDTIPLDPSAGLSVPVGQKCTEKDVRYNSGYTVQVSADKHITVAAPGAENGETIFARN
jgi:type II secretory pathway pseudopilin PulG